MGLTRRETLLLAAMATRMKAHAQIPAQLSITNSQGVTFRPHSNSSMPAIVVSLPGSNSAAAVIEMPEHAYHKLGKTDEPEWFYRMYTNDEHVRASPQWSREQDALTYRME